MEGPSLADLGWDAAREEEWREADRAGLVPGRVSVEHKGAHGVFTGAGEVVARAGRRITGEGAARPVVGDWVSVRPPSPGVDARITARLARRTSLSRRAAGGRDVEQTLAANVDVAFLVAGLDGDFSPRRIERALVLVWESGARPVVLLNKTDTARDAAGALRETQEVAAGVPIHAISARTGEGVDAVRREMGPGVTAVLLGSSGAGKSTLANLLFGTERQATREVRADDSRGRHTTSRRELIVLPGGGVLIDTPGLRELQLWATDGALDTAFAEVTALAPGCRFGDCGHETEPGCAVRAAVEGGALPRDRLESYLKLRRELRHLDTRVDVGAAQEEKRRWRSIHRQARKYRPRE